MKILPTLTSYISAIGVLISVHSMNAQNDSIVRDSTVYKQKYGLRIGGDLGRLIRTAIDKNYSGFEVVGDYRLTDKLYLAGEIGIEEFTVSNEVMDVTAQGSYFKAGVDYNLYRNWLDMDNMIFAGFRVAASTFSQTLNSYNIYNVNNQYWDEQVTVSDGTEYAGLSALWAELIIGIKAEVLTNLYLGINAQIKGRISDDSPGDFENLWIPGFNKTFDSGAFGFGFAYTLSYRIPIFKKEKVVFKE